MDYGVTKGCFSDCESGCTYYVIFSRTADRIATKFCMIILKIKSNDKFQNCIHSASTLTFGNSDSAITLHHSQNYGICTYKTVVNKSTLSSKSSSLFLLFSGDMAGPGKQWS